MMELRNEVGKALKKQEFLNTVKKAARFLKLPLKHIDLSIAIVKDETIREFNRRYRKKGTPTDVLSFLYEKPFQGEIIISYDTALRQAKRYKHSVHEEMRLLLTHGILHLAGYDHKTTKEKKAMKEAECEIAGEGLCGR